MSFESAIIFPGSNDFVLPADNKIKYMNGALFASLTNLISADLAGNLCISEHFGPDEIMTLSDEVTKKCGTISEATMEHFINDWKHEAESKQHELDRCMTRSKTEFKDAAIKMIFEKLAELSSQQKQQQLLLENFQKDVRSKEQNLQIAQEKLKVAEREISELRKKLDLNKNP